MDMGEASGLAECSNWQSLSGDIVGRITSFARRKDQGSLRKVCRPWDRAVRENLTDLEVFVRYPDASHVIQVACVRFPNVKGLRLRGLFKDDDLRHLDIFPTMGRLDLAETGFAKPQGDSLRNLAHLRRLKLLNLRATEVTDLCVDVIRNLENLVELDLSETKVGAGGMDFLRSLTDLKRLSLRYSRITDGVGPALAAIHKSLTHLDLRYTKVGDPFAKHLAQCRNLESLCIGGTNITDKGMRFIGELHSLTHLDLYRMQIGTEGAFFLRSLVNLTNLNLLGTGVDELCFEHLAQLVKLRDLNLGETDLGPDNESGSATEIDEMLKPKAGEIDGLLHEMMLETSSESASEIVKHEPGIVHLGKLKNLTRLDLSATDIGNEAMKSIGRLVNLTDLDVSETFVGDGGSKHLAKLMELRKLNVCGTLMGDESVVHIKCLPKIADLNMLETEVGNEGVKHMAALTSLTKLDLYGTDVGDEGVQWLSSLPRLVTMDLSMAKISKKGVELLERGIKAKGLCLVAGKPGVIKVAPSAR